MSYPSGQLQRVAKIKVAVIINFFAVVNDIILDKATPSQSLVSGPLQFMKSMWAGGILGLQDRKLQYYLLQKHYSPNELNFPKRHVGGGPETKD